MKKTTIYLVAALWAIGGFVANPAAGAQPLKKVSIAYRAITPGVASGTLISASIVLGTIVER
jgi:hypothetical protein